MRSRTFTMVMGAGAILALAGSALLAPAETSPPSERTEMSVAEPDTATDRRQILEHIHSIFRAYLERDRKTIRETHTDDWRGFTVDAASLMRGIDAYMAYADGAISSPATPLDYEILDVDISVHADVGIVYYLATYSVLASGEKRTSTLRSVDIYEKRDGRWIQSGSNICTLQSDVVRGMSRARPLAGAEREELLDARERVWRAWFAGDEETLREMLPPETVALDAGPVSAADRDEVFERSGAFARSGAALTRLAFPETRIQAFGPFAVLYTAYEFDVRKPDGTTSTSSGRATEFFVKRDGRWVNPGWHMDGGA